MTPNEEIEKALADLLQLRYREIKNDPRVGRFVENHGETLEALLTAAIKPEAREVGEYFVVNSAGVYNVFTCEEKAKKFAGKYLGVYRAVDQSAPAKVKG